MSTDTALFSSSPFSHIVLLSVSQYYTDDPAPVQQKKKSKTFSSKLSVLKYAVENLREAAAKCFSVDTKRVRDWRKNQTELQRLSEEDSNRTRLLLEGGRRLERSFR